MGNVESTAVSAVGRDVDVAAHYGNLFGEQRLLAERAGAIDRSNRSIVTVTGEDRLSWLHTLTTQQVADLPPWQATEALILTAQGHIAHHLNIVDDGQTTWIDTEPGAAGALHAYLERMRFLLRVEPREATAQWAMLSLVGPNALADLSAFEVSAPLPETWSAAPLPGGGWVRRTPWPGAYNVDMLLPRDRVPEIKAATADVGVAWCGLDAYEALRVAQRRPRLGNETDDRTLIHEVQWQSAVKLNKGCYPGQETVAKIHNLGQPPRRIVLLHFDGVSDELPAPGATVEREGKAVGFVGTAVRHFELGNIASAVVKRNTSDGTEVTVNDLRAVIDPENSGAGEFGDDDYGAGRRRVAEFMARRRSESASRP